MDSRVTAENHPDDPFGMGTGPTYADRSFGPNQEVIARHNLRPGTDVLQTTRAAGTDHITRRVMHAAVLRMRQSRLRRGKAETGQLPTFLS